MEANFFSTSFEAHISHVHKGVAQLDGDNEESFTVEASMDEGSIDIEFIDFDCSYAPNSDRGLLELPNGGSVRNFCLPTKAMFGMVLATAEMFKDADCIDYFAEKMSEVNAIVQQKRSDND